MIKFISKIFYFNAKYITKFNKFNLFYYMEANKEVKMDCVDNKIEKEEGSGQPKQKGVKKDNKKDCKEGEKGEKSGYSNNYEPKVVKGARDFLPFQMSIRNKAFGIISNVFKKHGAVEIDTPVFELKETLTGKYGEDSKLIYDLQDQGGEILSLRYDLTVPFARYMACHPFPSIKRYHIGKVYRRDTPNMSKGRYREFYQCDFDIAGPSYGKMIPDAEVLKVITEILSDLNLGNFLIKINHRKILDAMVALSDIPEDKFKTVCASVDKLDKEDWQTVKKELIEKGLDESQCNKLWIFVQYKDSPAKLLERLNTDGVFTEKGKEALEEMAVLIDYLEILGITKYMSFDLSLARGLDYYTGLIFEAVLTEGFLGSIAGGGRYDELLGMFSGKSIPSVGGSIGIERVFNILEEKLKVRRYILIR
jgi:histidyl-tRNA synthetase